MFNIDATFKDDDTVLLDILPESELADQNLTVIEGVVFGDAKITSVSSIQPIPENVSVAAGSTVKFSLDLSSSEGLTFQWQGYLDESG
jgi:hypothetical protein